MSPPGTSGRLFGGQVVAQALRAASLTVLANCKPYLLRAQFLRAGQAHKSLTLHVRRTRDGRAFANRYVEVKQDGKRILELMASFHIGETGDDWQPSHDVGPHPDSLAHWPSPLAAAAATQPFDLRPTNPPDADGRPALHPLWFRTKNALPDDPALHASVLAFASDFGLALSARWARAEPHAFTTTSLDHSVSFHRPAQPSDWLLLSTTTVSTAEGRCTVQGTLHTLDGALAATITQVALIRPLSGQR
jgi:acyl-CoA thioesterase